MVVKAYVCLRVILLSVRLLTAHSFALDGCPNGDLHPSYCQTNNARHLCYQQQHLQDCCASCARVRENVPGCEYGDKASWCSTITSDQCYGAADTCCHSCKKFKQNRAGEPVDKQRELEWLRRLYCLCESH